MTLRAAALCLTLIAPGGAQAGSVDGQGVIVTPSGHAVSLQEVIWNVPGSNGMALRFRFVAPDIAAGGGQTSAMAQDDMQWLCDNYALSHLASLPAPQAAEIIISLSDRPLPFGQAAPEAVQYFQSYQPVAGTCRMVLF